MDAKGKERLRSAPKRAKREYSCILSVGIELASAQNGVQLVASKLARVNGGIKRAERCHSTVQQQFWAEMSSEDQKRVLFIGAVFGAIRAAAENGKQLYARPTVALGISQPLLPGVGG